MFFQLFTVFIVELFRKLLNVDSQSSVTTFKIKTVGNSFHTIAVRVTIAIAVRIAVYQSRLQSQSRSKSSACSDDLSHQSQSQAQSFFSLTLTVALLKEVAHSGHSHE